MYHDHMQTVRRRPSAPKDLNDAGEALWRNVVGEFQLNSAELALLHELACTYDEIEALKVALAKSKPLIRGSRGQQRPNGLYAVLAAHRKLADQLTSALALPIDSEAVGRRRSAAARTIAKVPRQPKSRGRIHAIRETYREGA